MVKYPVAEKNKKHKTEILHLCNVDEPGRLHAKWGEPGTER